MKISKVSTGNKLQLGKIFSELTNGDTIYVVDGLSSKQEDIVYDVLFSGNISSMELKSSMYSDKNPDKVETKLDKVCISIYRNKDERTTIYEYVPEDIRWCATIYTLQDYLLIATKLEDIYMMIDKYKLKSKLV